MDSGMNGTPTETTPKEPIGDLRGLKPSSREEVGTFTLTRVER